MMKKKARVLQYIVLIVFLMVCFVGIYFVMHSDVIFGEYKDHKEFVTDLDDVEEVSNSELYITPKSYYPGGVLNTGTYPPIPETDGRGRATVTNPFVILEIVPDISQQSLAYLTSDPSEGLPFDPLELGIQFSKEQKEAGIDDTNGSFVIHKTNETPVFENGVWANKTVPNDSVNGNSALLATMANTFGGWFDNNNFLKIYDPEGTVTGTATDPTDILSRSETRLHRIDKYYEVSLTGEDISVQEFADKTVAQLQEEKRLFTVDDQNIAIREIAVNDENNWCKTFEEDTDDSRQYRLELTDAEIADEDFNNLSIKDMAEKYPELFLKDDSNNPIREKDIYKESAWSKSKRVEEKYVYHDEESVVPSEGYIKIVSPGEGEYLKMYSWEGLDGCSLKRAETDEEKAQANFLYVTDSSQLDGFENAVEKYPESDSYWPERIFSLRSMFQENIQDLVGTYIPLKFDDSSRGIKVNKIVLRTAGNEKILNSSYTYTYNYKSYKFKYVYYGIKINDILKRMLFHEDSDEKYSGTMDKDGNIVGGRHIKVITVTPDMINEVDSKDTPETLSYIERADMIYISQYSIGVADKIDNFVEFYYHYVEKSDKVFDKNNLETFFDHDLEWVDCMKIIERLSADSELPLMYSMQVGEMLNEGVNRDGMPSSHLCVSAVQQQKTEEVSSLNNISKLYLITSQFDLSTKNVNSTGYFMENIFPNIKKIPLANSSGSSPKYTGYYKRQECKCTDWTEEQHKNCYYLWNRFTFIPYDSGFNPDEPDFDLLRKYGYLDDYLKNNYLQGRGGRPSRGYDQMSGVRAGHDWDNDPQNVTFVTDNDTGANDNKTIYDNGTMSIMGFIDFLIMNSGSNEKPTMQFNVERYKKGGYTKIDNTSVLIDYCSDAKYKSDKTLVLKCSFLNRTVTASGEEIENKESGVIRSVELVNSSGDTKELYPEDGLEPSKKLEKKEVSFSGDIKGDESLKPIFGIEVPIGVKTDLYIPYQLYDWQNGYTTIRIKWTARTSKGEPGTDSYKPYQNVDDQFAEVTIGERGLFDLQ